MTPPEPTRQGTGVIRPLARGDLEQVADLYARIARPRDAAPPRLLADHFADTLLDQPWADPEIPSLVYDEDGQIRGFIGSHVRRFELDGARCALPTAASSSRIPAFVERLWGCSSCVRFSQALRTAR